MTTVAAAETEAEVTTEGDGVGPEGGRGRRVTWRSVLFTLLLVPAVIAVPVLAWTGATILRDEDTGQVLDAETDVNAPGFEALVTPTPTQLVVMLDDAGAVAGVQVLSLTDPAGGGTVVSAPVATHVEVAFVDTDTKALDELYVLAGLDGVEQKIETLFTAGMAEAVQVSADQWAGLIQPLGSLTVENPTAFTGVRADGTLGAGFGEGSVTLTPDQVADFILLKGEGEVDTARNDRQIAFWQAWIDAVGAEGDDTVPGEVDRGLGRFVRGLAAGEGSVVPLPVDQVPIPGVAVVDSNVFLPVQDAVDALSLRAIPFPVGVDRVRTRLVDGVGDVEGLKARAASVLVENGAEITVIGNASEFGQEQTTVVFFRADDEAAAQVLADAVGGSLERGESTNETVDVVVVIGKDFADADPEAGDDEPVGDDGIQVVPPTSVPIGGDGVTPGIAPGAPGAIRLADDTVADVDGEAEPVVVAARAADAKSGSDTVILDVGELLGITGHFLVTSGGNSRLVRTLAEEIERAVAETCGIKPIRVEGLDALRWVLLDYGDFVAHVFLDEERTYYDLERLWSDVPRVDWRAEGSPTPA